MSKLQTFQLKYINRNEDINPYIITIKVISLLYYNTI